MADLRERTRLSQALNELDMRIHSKLRFEEVLQSTLDGFVGALGADAGDIKLFDGEEWTVEYVCGFDPEVVGTRLSIAEAPVAARVAATSEPVTISDYRAEPPDFYVGFPATHHLVATIAVPLITRQQVVGSLFAWMRTEPRTFTDAEVDFARRVATSVGLALDNVRLLEAEMEARERAEAAEHQLEQELATIRVLLRASDELTGAVTPDEVLERLAGVVRYATGLPRVFINLIDMREQVLTPCIPAQGILAPRGDRIPFARLSETARRAIAGMAPVVLDYETPDTPPADRKIAEANNVRLALFIPLIYQNEIVGHITLDDPGARYDFSAEQIRVLASIAAQASVALQNSRQHEREHRIAETLQHAILAPPRPISALDVAYWYQPASLSASVGGDFYDVFELDDGLAALVIGDVAGKGIKAAQTTTLVREGIRAYAMVDPEPSSVLTRVNTLVCRLTATEVFATAFFGVLDCASGTLRYSTAGHPAPVVLADGSEPRMLDPGPGLLGAFEDAEFETRETTLEPGDVLCMFTDGAIEARNGEAMLGQEGVMSALARLQGTPVANLPHRLLSEVLSFANDSLRDDIAILCVARRNRTR